MFDKLADLVTAAKETVDENRRKGTKLKLPPAWFIKEIVPLLHYDPAKGTITWKRLDGSKTHRPLGHVSQRKTPLIHPFNNPKTGERYTVVLKYVAWAFIKGKWPSRTIEVIDGDQKNLRADNLRLSSPESKINITKRGKKYQARVVLNGELIPLGTWDTEEEALRMGRIKAKTKLMLLKRQKG